MLISSSKASRTSWGASCTATTRASNCWSDSSSTSNASKTSVASSGVRVATTSGSVAIAVACAWLMISGMVVDDVGIGTGRVVVVGGSVLDVVVVVEATTVEVVEVDVEVVV